MRTVVLGTPPPELAALLDRRRATGADRYDELWNGEYHMPPAPNAAHGRVDQQLILLLEPFAQHAGLVGTTIFNLGDKDDYRVPDAGYHRQPPVGDWIPTAAVVVEVVSPHDETWDKLDFYAAHGVDEILIADPADGNVTLLTLEGDSYTRVERSRLLGVAAAELEHQIDWPPTESA